MLRDTVRTGSNQKIAGRFLGVREHERSTAQERAQKDLQTAVTADVVEGAPDDRIARAAALYRAGEARQRVQRHFRIAGGSRGEENPFGLAMLASIMLCAKRLRRANGEALDARKVGRATVSSHTIASTSAVAMTYARRSRARSPGQRTMRRAIPSSSISANAAVS